MHQIKRRKPGKLVKLARSVVVVPSRANQRTPNDLSQLASDTILYNPSDLTSWVDSLLSEFNHQPLISLPSDLDFPDTIIGGKKSRGIGGKKLE
ncbi:hypothetical protein ACE6H2_015003 [Prunus campanulata]